MLSVMFDLSDDSFAVSIAALNLKKPYLLIDATELSPERVHQFVTARSLLILNVASPAASGATLAYAYTLKAMTCF